MANKQWTPLEHRVAASELCDSDVAELLGVAESEVVRYRKASGLIGTSRVWTEHEKTILHFFPILSVKDLATILPHRSLCSINHKMIKLGLIAPEDNTRPWSAEDDLKLRTLNRFTVCSRPYTRLLFQRGRSVVEGRMRVLGIVPHDRRMFLPTLTRAKLLRLLLTGVELERILEEFVEIRPYVLKHQLKLYSEQLGVPVKGLE